MNSLARRRRTLDIWPGFVDALSSLILVMVFVLLLFAIGQFVLSQTITSKNEALAQLNAQIMHLMQGMAPFNPDIARHLVSFNNMKDDVAFSCNDRTLHAFK